MKKQIEELNNKTQVKITYEVYKKIKRAFPKQILKQFLIPSIIMLITSLALMIPDEADTDPITWFDLLIFDIIVVLFILGIVLIVNSATKKSSYKTFIKNSKNYIEYEILIYDEYLTIKNEYLNEKIMFNDIKECKDLNNILYLQINQNIVVPISKKDISPSLIDNMRYRIDNKNNNSISHIEIDKYKKNINSKKNTIEIIMLIIFVFCFFTPWISLQGWNLLAVLNKAEDIEYFKYSYGGLIGLIIPLLSLILGIKYFNKGINCIKNIVIGAIMCIFPLIVTSGSLISGVFNYEQDYSKISKYKDIIKIELPKNAKYSSIEYNAVSYNNYISNTAKFTNKNEYDLFFNNIKSNSNWITYDNMSTNLSNFIPEFLICASNKQKNNCYYSIYIDEINDYNKIPEESGIYHIKLLMYDPNVTSLKIEDFEFTYKE